MGANGCTTSWSTLTTRSPACMAALEKAPRPAKISTNRGGESRETVACETAVVSSESQSVWVHR